MVERLDEAVRTELTTLEEVLTQRTELVAAARGARRQAETVAQQLQGLAFWRGVPLSPLQVAENVSFVEEYRWVASFLSWVEKIRQEMRTAEAGSFWGGGRSFQEGHMEKVTFEGGERTSY